MPLTPFHAAVPWLAHVRWPRAFSFWALTWGAMVPDLEVVVLFLVTGDIHVARGPMHSLLGVLTLNLAVVAFVVWVLMPRALAWAERRWPDRPDVFRFAGSDLRRDPRDPVTVVASAAFGGLTHVLVDVPTHAYNPLFWPVQQSPLTLVPFADALWWDALTTVLWFLFFVAIVAVYWRR